MCLGNGTRTEATSGWEVSPRNTFSSLSTRSSLLVYFGVDPFNLCISSKMLGERLIFTRFRWFIRSVNFFAQKQLVFPLKFSWFGSRRAPS